MDEVDELNYDRRMERSAIEYVRSMGDMSQPTLPDDEWEPAYWDDGVTILVSRTDEGLGAIVVDRPLVTDPRPEVHLIRPDRMAFLALQIHRGEAGVLNGFRPVESVTLGG